jgi:hypothetical protein
MQFLKDAFELWLTEDRKGLAAAFVVGALAAMVVVLVRAGIVRIFS